MWAENVLLELSSLGTQVLESVTLGCLTSLKCERVPLKASESRFVPLPCHTNA